MSMIQDYQIEELKEALEAITADRNMWRQRALELGQKLESLEK